MSNQNIFKKIFFLYKTSYISVCSKIKNLKTELRYYTTFKVRKLELLFYKTNTCLQKATTCIGLQAEQIFTVNM